MSDELSQQFEDVPSTHFPSDPGQKYFYYIRSDFLGRISALRSCFELLTTMKEQSPDIYDEEVVFLAHHFIARYTMIINVATDYEIQFFDSAS